MYSKIKIFGHPLHPMLVNFPIAFYTATMVAFIAYAFAGGTFLFRLGYTANAAGVAMAIVAAIPGFLDWALGIPGNSRAKRHGLQHMGFNVSALILFAINLWLNSGQWNAPNPNTTWSVLLPVSGFLLTLAAGYIGWTLVQTDHSGVQFTSDEERCLIGRAGPGHPKPSR